jgi:hypothetical protein
LLQRHGSKSLSGPWLAIRFASWPIQLIELLNVGGDGGRIALLVAHWVLIHVKLGDVVLGFKILPFFRSKEAEVPIAVGVPWVS